MISRKTATAWTPAAAVALAALLLASAAAAQEPPRRFDLTCATHSVDKVSSISTTLRFAIDLDAASMRAYRDGKLGPSVPIKVSDGQLVLRDEGQPPFGDYASVHVRETVNRLNGAFASEMKFTRTGGEAEETRTEGQCAFARYSGADAKPIY